MEMLFDYSAFIDELKGKVEKKSHVEKYESLVEPIYSNPEDQIWYKEYISKFSPFKYTVPKELQNDFDWNLLLQLVLGSFSSDYELKNERNNNDNLFEFYLAVKSGDQTVVKTISELWSFQILRLYEIYIEEQMNLQILKVEDENEHNAIQSERAARLHRWDIVLQNVTKETIIGKTENSMKEIFGDIF